ncbi:hypothetical protein J1N10_21115, partial [Carboxylicivirga sp. A043]|uniref:hypothetical protein n=1 Tax=Carboxylicivirga litoralis TaxID=2816963 RepID=UPI0021CB2829
DVLKKVNEKISELNKENESLKLIDDSFTDFDALELDNYISEKIANLEAAIKKNRELILNIDTLFAGNESMISVDTFFDTIHKKLKVNNRIKELEVSLNTFKKKHNHIAEKKNIETKRQDLFKTDELLRELIKTFVAYEDVLGKI